jgi:hypothetical protein
MNKITSISDYFKAIAHPNVVIYIQKQNDTSNLLIELEELAVDYTSLNIYFTSIDIEEFVYLKIPCLQPEQIPCFMFFKDGFEICTTKGTNINIIEKIVQNYFL